MSDFETHPRGTGDRLARLEAERLKHPLKRQSIASFIFGFFIALATPLLLCAMTAPHQSPRECPSRASIIAGCE